MSEFDCDWQAVFAENPQTVAAIAQCPFRAMPWQPKSNHAARVLLEFFAGPERVRASQADSEPPASSVPPLVPDPVGQGARQDQQANALPFTASQAASTEAPDTVAAEDVPPLASETASFVRTMSSLGGWSWQNPVEFTSELDQPEPAVAETSPDTSR